MNEDQAFKDRLAATLEAQRQRQQMEMDNPALVDVQDEVSEYYIHKKMTVDDYAQDNRNEHMKKANIHSIRDSVKSFMPDAYTTIDEIRDQPIEDMRKTRLHHGRARSLHDENGMPVLKLDIAGSGFSQFRTEHKGFWGKNTVEILGKRFKLNADIEGQLEKEITERWYHRSWLAGFIKGIRTPEQLREYNEGVREVNEIIRQQFAEKRAEFESHFGESVGYGTKDYTHMRRSVGETGTRITLAGPLALKGASNSGDYSIENLREHILAASADYLTGIFSAWNGIEDARDVHIVIKGHSRGAVASAEGAMRVKAWVHEVFPDYEPYVKFDLTQYDPVPGTGSKSGINETVDLQGRDEVEEKGVKMRPLGDSVESTVFYSMHANEDFAHRNFFDPQAVMGAKRLILTPFTHSVGLERIDRNKTGKDGERTDEEHRQGYTDARTGEVYMGSSINELEAGVYIVDEQNTLIRFNSYAEAESILKSILKDTYRQGTRHNTVLEMAKCWFERSAPSRVEKSKEEFTRLHQEHKQAKTLADEKETADSAEAIFANLPVQITESEEALRALEANDTTKLLELAVPQMGTPQEMAEIFDVTHNGFTDAAQVHAIKERLRNTNPLNRLLLNKTIDQLSNGFVEDGSNAYYSPGNQKIAIKKAVQLKDLRGAFNTLYHEMGHMTDNVAASKLDFHQEQREGIETALRGCSQYIQLLRENADEEEQHEYDALELERKAVTAEIEHLPDDQAIARLRLFVESFYAVTGQAGSIPMPTETYAHKGDKDISKANPLASEYFLALENDYKEYRDNFTALVYGQSESAEIEQKLREQIKNRLYWDIVARAEETQKRGGDMGPYGGSVEDAMEIAAAEMHFTVEGSSIVEMRKWLIDHDPLKSTKGMPQRYHDLSGVSDIFGAFAKTADQQDENAKKIKQTMQYGHADSYWKDTSKMSVNLPDGTTMQVSAHITSESWAQMTACNCDGGMEQEMFYREFMPRAYEAYKKMRLDAVKKMGGI